MTEAMRDALVHAKLGLSDLRASLATTTARLEAERTELATVRRRQGLAAQIDDQETVAIAERFAGQHQERVAMLEVKQMVQQQELSLAEREYEEMSSELRLILSGVAPGARSPEPAATATTAPYDGPAGSALDDSIIAGSDEATGSPIGGPMGSPMGEAPARRTRAEREADAEERLAALKRRMGK